MDKKKIKAMLIERGIKHKDVAEKLNVTRSCISVVINGYQKSRRVKRGIADMVGMPYEKLWGDKEAI